ncbi:ATPase AAA [Candidatus Magnetomorum sp. HK-1]|nr:ATPase AAA [Candidatus Magnetomorum sp. HK-1]
MIKRINKIEKFLKAKKSLLILGPRGSGKTYYIKILSKSMGLNFFYIDLLETDTYRKYLISPSLLRKEIEFKMQSMNILYIFIDEIQKIPALFSEIHKIIEDYKKKCIFILTGSSARKLKSKNVDLLSGRALYIPFFPFNLQEIDFNLNLLKILQFGTLPDAFLEEDIEIVIEYLKTYTHLYLKEEILQESIVRNIEGFGRFLELAAFVNGSPVNFTKMSRQIGISSKTIKEYFQILEDTLLIHRIPAWTYSIKKQIQKSSKYFFFDNGLLNSLKGELKTELKESSYRFGHLFENMVINEIIKVNTLNNYDYKLYHYRTNHNLEIDLIVQKNINTTPIAVEIKSSISPDYKDVKSLFDIKADYPDAKLVCICRCQEPYQDEGILFLPFVQGIKEIFNEPIGQ